MENKIVDALTEEQVHDIYNKLDNMDTNSNKELLQLEGKPDNSDIHDQELVGDTNIVGVSDISEEDMRKMGLDEETINDLKDVKVDTNEINNVKVNSDDYLGVISDYMDISTNDAMILIGVLTEYRNNPNANNYFDKLPDKVKEFVNNIRINLKIEVDNPSKSNNAISKEKATKFVLDNIINDTTFGKVMDDYTVEMSGVMNDMHGEFQAIIQESFDDLFSNIEKLKDSHPEQAETLQKFYDSFKDASTFNRQLKFIEDGHLTKKKINKWLTRFDNDCFYFNKKVNSDVNNSRGIKFVKVESLVPTIKHALDGFTEKQIKQFIIVFIRSLYKMDMDDIANLFYIYGVISAIDSFRYNTNFDTDLGKTLFGNITKVIQKIISLD